jgi:capsular exopolysaccharide synthesis family protein
MTLRQAFYIVRRWRSLVVAGVLIGVVVGWVSAPGRAPRTMFEATHSLLADPQIRRTSRVEQAAVMATTGAVPDRVATGLGLDRQFVRSAVSSETPPNKGLLLVTGRSTDRRQAEALANVTAEELIRELGGPQAPLRTLERAVATPIPASDVEGPHSRPSRALLLGAVGLLLGMGAAFGIERFDTRIRSKQTAEDVLGAPVVAEVPAVPDGAGDRLVTAGEAGSLVEAYRRLGTMLESSVHAQQLSGALRVVAVTSGDAGEGKTTTVAHLAAALGEMGRSVLAISADLRRPRLHLFFDRPEQPGLVDVLRGDVGLGSLDLATPVRGVRLLASGAAVDNPAALLEQAHGVLRAARSLADIVLVDTPPLLGVSDTAELVRHTDGALLVVRAGRTSTAAARRSAELLGRLHIPLIGAVLVGADR